MRSNMPETGNDLASFDVSKMTIRERLEELTSLLRDIDATVARAGLILMSLEADGYDTSKLRPRCVIKAVRDVGKGFLTREAFSAYYGPNPTVLPYFAALPHEEQLRLVGDGAVKVCSVENGKTTDTMVKIEELTAAEAKLVFDKVGHAVRTVAQQAHFLRAERIRTNMMVPRISHNEETGIIFVRGGVTAKQLNAYMKAHNLK